MTMPWTHDDLIVIVYNVRHLPFRNHSLRRAGAAMQTLTLRTLTLPDDPDAACNKMT
jgi:hypothetical protein